MRRQIWSSKPPPAVAIQWGHPICYGLIGAWHFNDAGGLIANDAAMLYGGGTLTGSAITWGSGDLSISSASSNQIVIADRSATIPLTSQITIEQRFQMDALRNYNALAQKTNSNTGSPIDMYIDAGGTLSYFVNANQSTLAGFVAGPWYHLVTTAQSAAINGFQDIWLNGILKSHGTGTPSITEAAKPFRIGRRDDGATQFGGLFSHVRLWNRILQPTEIQALYANPWCIMQPVRRALTGFPPPQPFLPRSSQAMIPILSQ